MDKIWEYLDIAWNWLNYKIPAWIVIILVVLAWLELGRSIRDTGSHARGYNHKSVGLCMVGGMAEDNSAENNFTAQQWTALLDLVKQLKTNYPEAEIIGHNEISEKECPSFDVQKWKEDNI
jgi:N-acetylmuramoyl-L-alanine amidase